MNRATTIIIGAGLVLVYMWMAGDDLKMRQVEAQHQAESMQQARAEARRDAKRQRFQALADEGEQMTSFKASAP